MLWKPRRQQRRKLNDSGQAFGQGANRITFNGNIEGTGNLTISGGGTVTFNCGSYKGGTTTTQKGTTLVINYNPC